MQIKKKKAFLLNGQVTAYRKLTFQQRKQAKPTEASFYFFLEGFDFNTECYGTLEIYHKLVKNEADSKSE